MIYFRNFGSLLISLFLMEKVLNIFLSFFLNHSFIILSLVNILVKINN